MTQLPLELTKENIIVFEKKMYDYWGKIYNSYVLEILKTVHLMLNFRKIKINVKKIEMEPLPKKSDLLNILKPSLNLNLSIGLKDLNIFKKEEKSKTGEFESIMKSLITLLEYDKTYPEAKKLLLELRKEKKDEGDVVKNLFSAKKLFGKITGIAGFAKDLVFKKEEAQKAKKSAYYNNLEGLFDVI